MVFGMNLHVGFSPLVESGARNSPPANVVRRTPESSPQRHVATRKESGGFQFSPSPPPATIKSGTLTDVRSTDTAGPRKSSAKDGKPMSVRDSSPGFQFESSPPPRRPVQSQPERKIEEPVSGERSAAPAERSKTARNVSPGFEFEKSPPPKRSWQRDTEPKYTDSDAKDSSQTTSFDRTDLPSSKLRGNGLPQQSESVPTSIPVLSTETSKVSDAASVGNVPAEKVENSPFARKEDSPPAWRKSRDSARDARKEPSPSVAKPSSVAPVGEPVKNKVNENVPVVSKKAGDDFQAADKIEAPVVTKAEPAASIASTVAAPDANTKFKPYHPAPISLTGTRKVSEGPKEPAQKHSTLAPVPSPRDTKPDMSGVQSTETVPSQPASRKASEAFPTEPASRKASETVPWVSSSPRESLKPTPRGSIKPSSQTSAGGDESPRQKSPAESYESSAPVPSQASPDPSSAQTTLKSKDTGADSGKKTTDSAPSSKPADSSSSKKTEPATATFVKPDPSSASAGSKTPEKAAVVAPPVGGKTPAAAGPEKSASATPLAASITPAPTGPEKLAPSTPSSASKTPAPAGANLQMQVEESNKPSVTGKPENGKPATGAAKPGDTAAAKPATKKPVSGAQKEDKMESYPSLKPVKKDAKAEAEEGGATKLAETKKPAVAPGTKPPAKKAEETKEKLKPVASKDLAAPKSATSPRPSIAE